ncbi:MAG: hypothetical protein ACI8P9_003298 [Parasphingorhabdus sp.]|jgi:hypothetical protein
MVMLVTTKSVVKALSSVSAVGSARSTKCFGYHARRKFVDTVKAMPARQKLNGKVSKVDVALSKIRKLDAIEGTIKPMIPEDRYQHRQLAGYWVYHLRLLLVLYLRSAGPLHPCSRAEHSFWSNFSIEFVE